jgi:branched-chain amino acid transport system permease protein
MGPNEHPARFAGALGVTVVTFAVTVAWLVPGLRLYQFAMVGTLAVAMLGLNILTGYNGQISLGHGAFIGIGGYTAAILVRDLAMPYPLALVAAAATAFVVGGLIGIPGLRLPGSSLALVTLAFAFALPQLIRKYDGLTGGSYGIYTLHDQQLNSPWAGLTNDQFRYLVVVLVGTLLFWAGWNIVRGRWGLAMMAVRDHAISAGSMGVDVARTKVTAFAISAGFAGAAGALQYVVVGSVSPEQFSLAVSFSLVSGIVIGGLGTVAGALVGALFLTFVPYYSPEILPAAPAMLTGVATVLFIILAPGGIVGLLRVARRRLRHVAAPGAPTDPSAGGLVGDRDVRSSVGTARI